MNIIDMTEKNLTKGDLQAVVALGVLKAHEKGWLVFGSDTVEVGWLRNIKEWVVKFNDGAGRANVVHLTDAAVKAQFERVKEAQVAEYCEKIRGHIEEAMLCVNAEAENIERLDVPKSLEYFVEQLVGDLRAQGDRIEQLMEELEALEEELADD